MKVEKKKFDAILGKLISAKPVPRTSVKSTGKHGWLRPSFWRFESSRGYHFTLQSSTAAPTANKFPHRSVKLSNRAAIVASAACHLGGSGHCSLPSSTLSKASACSMALAVCATPQIFLFSSSHLARPLAIQKPSFDLMGEPTCGSPRTMRPTSELIVS